MAVRRKCFVTYHHADEKAVANFVDAFDQALASPVLGTEMLILLLKGLQNATSKPVATLGASP